MSDDPVRWELNYRHVKLSSDKLTSIGFNVFYLERECELCIGLSPPIDGATPQKKIIFGELRRLHEALGDILSEQRL